MSVFDESNINKLFKCYEGDDPYKLVSRESTTLEFKESFSISALAKYAKTMVSFANRDGGYLIFGVKDNPRKVVGLKDNTFEEYDDEKFVEKLNEYFSPEIKYTKTTLKYKELNIGLIYTYKSLHKPVICTKYVNNALREGAIYYRYRAKSSEIKYADLIYLLDEIRKNEQRLWMQTFAKMAKIGVNNLSLLDLKNGKININGNPDKKDIFIDNDLLAKIKFIKEGSFKEKDGAPALKLIGKINGITGAIVHRAKKEIIPTTITEKYLLTTFINQTGTANPINYIDAFCHFSVKYLPFYYFIYLIQKIDNSFDKTKLKAEISKITVDAKFGKKYLLERIKSDDNFKEEKITGKDADLKAKYFVLFNDNSTNLEGIEEKNIDIQLRMILNIKNEETIKKLIIPLLKKYLENNYEEHKSLLRKAISYVDKQLYFDKLINFS